jgi:hypothetical protein
VTYGTMLCGENIYSAGHRDVRQVIVPPYLCLSFLPSLSLSLR